MDQTAKQLIVALIVVGVIAVVLMVSINMYESAQRSSNIDRAVHDYRCVLMPDSTRDC